MPFVQLDGLRMHYREKGSGDKCVVLVHGFLASARWWQKVMRALPARYHVFALDQRGYGETDKPPQGYAIPDLSRDVYHFAGKMGLKKFVLVGHSMGGGVSLQFALDHSNLLQALVLVNSMGADGLNMLTPEMQEMFKGLRGNKEALMGLFRANTVRPLDEAFASRLIDDMLRVGDAAWEQGPAAITNLRLGARLGEIKVPALAIWGDKDLWIPLDDVLKTYRGIPGCGLHIFHRVGHDPHAQVPRELAAVLVDFMESTGW